MRALFKAIGYAIGMIVLVTSVYIGYLWATYIDDSITSGSKYGFNIGASKLETFTGFSQLATEHPKLQIYISYGDRAGDFISLPAETTVFEQVSSYDNWDLQLDGQYEFHNIIRLRFESDSLYEIYRHRKYFELP